MSEILNNKQMENSTTVKNMLQKVLMANGLSKVKFCIFSEMKDSDDKHKKQDICSIQTHMVLFPKP